MVLKIKEDDVWKVKILSWVPRRSWLCGTLLLPFTFLPTRAVDIRVSLKVAGCLCTS